MKVELMNLKQLYLEHEEEFKSAIHHVLDTQQFIQGKHVEGFSKNYCKALNLNWGIGCSNGTSAIFVALKCLGVGQGDEVITVANTFFGTVEAIIETGATPVLVDCRADTYGMDVAAIENKITNKTKVLLPVHLYGNPVDMEALCSLAQKHNLKIIEDCAQSHLATFNGKATGGFGEYGTFSFYPGKNLGAFGDAGFITAKTQELHQKASMYVDHGRVKKYEHEFPAGNHRMDSLQAVVLDVKLKYLKNWTQKRIDIARFYDEVFKGKGFKVIEVLPGAQSVYHLYLVEVSNRDEVMKELSQAGIGVGIHYPIPLHLQPALKYLGHKEGDFPICEKASKRIVSIPMCPTLTADLLKYVVDQFLKIAKV